MPRRHRGRLSLGAALRPLVALLLGGAAAGCAGRFDEKGVVALLKEQEAAWNRGDLAGYMNGYWRSPKLIFTSGGQIRRGWDETLAKYQARYGSSPATMGTLHFEPLDVKALGHDGAVVLGRWQLTGLAKPASGLFSVVLERTPAGWRVVHDHTTADPQ